VAYVEDQRWAKNSDGERVRTAYNGPKPWRLRYRTPDGRARSESFAREVDARRKLVNVEHSKQTRGYVDPALGKQTFGEYAIEWLATKHGVSERTRVNVVGRIENYARPFFGPMPLAAIRPTHARGFVAALVARKLAPATVKAIVLTTGQVFGQAVFDGIIVRSPFFGIELPPNRERQEMRFLAAEEVNTLAAAIDSRYRVAVYVAAYGGLRAGELWALTPDRVNVLARTIDVRESLGEVGGRVLGGPTKTGKARTITVPRFLAEMIGEHIGRYPSDEYLFTAAEGGPVRHRNFMRRHFKPAVARAGSTTGSAGTTCDTQARRY
jgi:integrase